MKVVVAILILELLLVGTASAEVRPDAVSQTRTRLELIRHDFELFKKVCVVPRSQSEFDTFLRGSDPCLSSIKSQLRFIGSATITDAWGNSFRYRIAESSAVVTSLGEDSREGGVGQHQDLSLTIPLGPKQDDLDKLFED